MYTFKENEIDGFTLLNLEDEDVFRMLPGKVGPAQKILTYLQREQKEYKDTLQQPSQCKMHSALPQTWL